MRIILQRYSYATEFWLLLSVWSILPSLLLSAKQLTSLFSNLVFGNTLIGTSTVCLSEEDVRYGDFSVLVTVTSERHMRPTFIYCTKKTSYPFFILCDEFTLTFCGSDLILSKYHFKVSTFNFLPSSLTPFYYLRGGREKKKSL